MAAAVVSEQGLSPRQGAPCRPKRDTLARKWALPERYELGAILGAGSFGTAYEAVDHSEGRLCAISLFKHIFDDPKSAEQILRDVSILRQLEHQNVLQVYDVLSPAGASSFEEMYIVAELCDSDLKRLCKADVVLNPLQINTVLYNLLVGLRYLHSAGVCHGNLTPAGCLVNQDCTVKISGFGCARVVGRQTLPCDVLPWPSVARRCHRPRSKFPGSLRRGYYHAPELLLREENCGEAVDLWSTGCIYGELLGTLEGMPIEDRCPLFCPHARRAAVGSAPDWKHYTRERHCRLDAIFRLLGTPSEAGLQSVGAHDAQQYILQSFCRHQAGQLRSRLSHVPDESLDLLERMLEFSAGARITAECALEHRVFAGIRDEEKELIADGLVSLEFEKEAVLGESQLRWHLQRHTQAHAPASLPRKVQGVSTYFAITITAMRTEGEKVTFVCSDMAGNEVIVTFDIAAEATTAELWQQVAAKAGIGGARVQLLLPNGTMLAATDMTPVLQLLGMPSAHI